MSLLGQLLAAGKGAYETWADPNNDENPEVQFFEYQNPKVPALARGRDRDMRFHEYSKLSPEFRQNLLGEDGDWWQGMYNKEKIAQGGTILGRFDNIDRLYRDKLDEFYNRSSDNLSYKDILQEEVLRAAQGGAYGPRYSQEVLNNIKSDDLPGVQVDQGAPQGLLQKLRTLF